MMRSSHKANTLSETPIGNAGRPGRADATLLGLQGHKTGVLERSTPGIIFVVQKMEQDRDQVPLFAIELEMGFVGSYKPSQIHALPRQ